MPEFITVNDSSRMLVVDDDPEIIYMLCDFFKAHDFIVDGAINAQDAFQLLDKKRYSVMILDIILPGMSGKEMLKTLKIKYPYVEVIMITGEPDLETVPEIIKDGAYDYMSKPLNCEKLLEKVQNAVEKRRDTIEMDMAQTTQLDLSEEPMMGYSYVEDLGSGSMADVVIVEKDKQKYALKKFHSLEKISSNPHAIVNKFLEVIEILSKIEHPNVVKVYEYGFPAGLDKPYVVMEYIEGNTLDYFVNKDLISFDQKLELIRQIAAALARIHEEGICHRDMKPANVLINMDLQAKISDFGISRLLDSGDSNTECFRGSPAYMAPECFIKDEKIDRMSDVFSLGCMAYELLTGQRPFHGNNIVEMMDKLKASSPVNPVFIDRSVSNDIQNLLGAMLQKDPVKRPEAGEVAAALKLFRKDNRDLENKQFMSEKFDIPDNHLAWKA